MRNVDSGLVMTSMEVVPLISSHRVTIPRAHFDALGLEEGEKVVVGIEGRRWVLEKKRRRK